MTYCRTASSLAWTKPSQNRKKCLPYYVDPILFGKEMDEIEEKYLNEYGIYTLDIQEIKVNWENGMPI